MGNLLDMKTVIIVLLVVILLLTFFMEYKERLKIRGKQEKELQMYQMYVKPLEELIREIRAKQHEFDNHLNAILNMHLMIDNYEELVESQQNYIHDLALSRDNSYLGLLRVSNKIIAGFIYSKLKSASESINVELFVGNKEVFTNVPEKDIVEVVGTLMDNAFEACNEKENRIKIYLTSEQDRMIFVIKNMHERIQISELSRFFERGYSTKTDKEKRGFGLYNAKQIIRDWNGEIFVENETIDGENYLSFRVEL